MSQQELNLFERRIGVVVNAGARPAGVVGGEVLVSHLGGIVTDISQIADSSNPLPQTLPFGWRERCSRSKSSPPTATRQFPT
jgi:hypothetical protein